MSGATGPSREFVIASSILYLLITIILTAPFVGIKIFTSVHIKRQFRWDDLLILLAQLLSIPWIFINIAPPPDDDDAAKDPSIGNTLSFHSYLISILYAPAMLAAMLAMLVNLERIFVVRAGNAIWWTIRTLMAAFTVFYTSIFFANIFLCNPRQALWNKSAQAQGRCLSLSGTLIATGVFNIVVKIAILLLPCAVIRTLKISQKQKFTVTMYFSGTLISLIASIVRLVFSARLLLGIDPQRAGLMLGFFAGTEVACLIFATAFTSVPRFRKWLREGRPDRRKRSADGTDWRRNHYGRAAAPPSPRADDKNGWCQLVKKWEVRRWYELERAAGDDRDYDDRLRTPSKAEIHVTRSFDVTAEQRPSYARHQQSSSIQPVHCNPPSEWAQAAKS